jgi:AraC-like DNA-binding protein
MTQPAQGPLKAGGPAPPNPSPLAAAIAAHISEAGIKPTPIPGLRLIFRDRPTPPSTSNHPPSVCLIGQGARKVVVGERLHAYDEGHYMVTSVNLPATFQILGASPERPFLALTLALDLSLMAELIMGSPRPGREAATSMGATVSELEPALEDAFLRLVSLLDSPGDIPALSPLVLREIHYRLLMGAQGGHLRQMASGGAHGSRIFQVIDWLKGHFREKFLVNDFASRFGMSPSSLHHHFKALTALSPIQYQKRLRLIEARRLILVERLQVSDAAFRVGYESPSQFTREYSRCFGATPSDDARSLKEGALGPPAPNGEGERRTA